ncbi:secretory pathway protein Sec39-domain-containing protein [Scleroderma yunnanense]
MSTDQPHTLWLKLEDHELTVDLVRDLLAAVDNDLWVAAACADRLVDDVGLQRALLELGISRTASAVDRSRAPLLQLPESAGTSRTRETLSVHFVQVPEDAQLCQIRAILLERLDRLSSFVEVYQAIQLQEEDSDDITDQWEDDPWAVDPDNAPSVKPESLSTDVQIPLSEFLIKDLVGVTCFFASHEFYTAVRTLLTYHSSVLWPYRFAILNSIPTHSSPSQYSDLLPAYDTDRDAERSQRPMNWRTVHDWVESQEVMEALRNAQALSGVEVIPYTTPALVGGCLGPQELTAWYRQRVDDIISSTGMLDIALATIQHGASLGVPDLDELGEDLSLLTRLVYHDSQPNEPSTVEDWTLERWKSMEPAQVVQAYLAYSTPETIAVDILHLVMPYLFVLEARVERAGQPDPNLATSLLYEYILNASLPIIAAIFEASKPTLPMSQRIIRSDEDIARLALACLYGSDSRNEWSTMGLIFECLPAWDIEPRVDHDADEAHTTIASLGALVAPSTMQPHCSAADLFLLFKPLPLVSLSRALDILDVHLECGEILSRWSVSAPLRWFLQSADDAAEQRAWANRMARRTGCTSNEMKSRGDWEWLLEDMQKLRTTSENGVKGAFGLLSREEVCSIFLSGLLSSGLFDIARAILLQRNSHLYLSDVDVESICLSVSREFYDNASSGNYKTGDMKLAYDCLAVPPPSERLTRERDFIEATSRLSSFNISSRPGVQLSPLEIRLAKDRLSLISRVLSSTADAYKHTEVILDLLYKLGYSGDVIAEVKTLAMLSDTALQAEDFVRAYETSQKMIETVSNLRRQTSDSVIDPAIREACEVCWVACYQLGRQLEFDDVGKKQELLGRALEFCPADKLSDVLGSWRRLQKDTLENRRDYLAHRSTTRQRLSTPWKPMSSLQIRLRDLHMPGNPFINAEDAAVLAGRAFNRVASNFPFAVSGQGWSGGSGDSARSRSRDESRLGLNGEDVSAQASRVLQRGIGWLLGADDEG